MLDPANPSTGSGSRDDACLLLLQPRNDTITHTLEIAYKVRVPLLLLPECLLHC